MTVFFLSNSYDSFPIRITTLFLTSIIVGLFCFFVTILFIFLIIIFILLIFFILIIFFFILII